MAKVYHNSIPLGGLNITEASPIDDRSIVESETALAELFSNPITDEKIDYQAILHDGLEAKSIQTENSYVWKESVTGLIPGGYTYPGFDPNYGGKTYNFVRSDRVVKLTLTYLNASIPGLAIPDEDLPYHVLRDNKENVMVSMRSIDSGFEELEFPDKVEITTTGILIVLDPFPAINEVFKITIS